LIKNIDSRKRWLALILLCLGDLMIVLDTTIVNVALPSIRADLGFSETSLVWVVNAYMLTFGGFLLLGGRLGDLFGHRRLFLLGIALFTFASLACGMANSQGLLIGARAVQGLGGAVVSAVALSLIMNLFTEPDERAKAMGFFGFVMAGGGSIGVLLGGVLTDTLDWHWIFLVNLPIGVAVFALCLVFLPASRSAAAAERLDIAGRSHRDCVADGRRLRDRERQRGRLDVFPDNRPARRRGGALRALPRHGSPGSLTARAAQNLPAA
jgi:MFS family permease